jgi:hypothetical protein
MISWAMPAPNAGVELVFHPLPSLSNATPSSRWSTMNSQRARQRSRVSLELPSAGSLRPDPNVASGKSCCRSPCVPTYIGPLEPGTHKVVATVNGQPFAEHDFVVKPEATTFVQRLPPGERSAL